MTDEQATEGYWNIRENGDFEYVDAESGEIVDVVPFAKARSLAAFFMWQLVESIGE